MLRRIQSVALVVALLTAPLALAARGYACVEECTMSCCRGHHMRPMKCGHGGGAKQCAMGCKSHSDVDYGLASPLAPTQLSAAARLPLPEVARSNFAAEILPLSVDYCVPPFEPPRP